MIEAIQNGDTAAAKALLAADPAEALATTSGGTSALLLSVYYGRSEITALLRKHLEVLSIFEAAAVGEAAQIGALLDKQEDLANAYAPDGFTPLGLAAFFGHEDAATLLLARGANANQASRNANRVMPLHSAVAGRHLAIARLLVKHGADVNARQESGFTPLHGAAENGSLEMIDLLLLNGADVSARSEGDKSALDYAREGGHEAAMQRLEAR